MRLWHGARCFERYRREFGLAAPCKPASCPPDDRDFACAFWGSATTATWARSTCASWPKGTRSRSHIANPLCHGTLAGLVTHVADWRDELDWVRAAGEEGIILFENVAEQRGAAAG